MIIALTIAAIMACCVAWAVHLVLKPFSAEEYREALEMREANRVAREENERKQQEDFWRGLLSLEARFPGIFDEALKDRKVMERREERERLSQRYNVAALTDIRDTVTKKVVR